MQSGSHYWGKPRFFSRFWPSINSKRTHCVMVGMHGKKSKTYHTSLGTEKFNLLSSYNRYACCILICPNAVRQVKIPTGFICFVRCKMVNQPIIMQTWVCKYLEKFLLQQMNANILTLLTGRSWRNHVEMFRVHQINVTYKCHKKIFLYYYQGCSTL